MSYPTPAPPCNTRRNTHETLDEIVYLQDVSYCMVEVDGRDAVALPYDLQDGARYGLQVCLRHPAHLLIKRLTYVHRIRACRRVRVVLVSSNSIMILVTYTCVWSCSCVVILHHHTNKASTVALFFARNE